MTYLGADGLFIAIILSLLTVEITMLVEKLEWKFKGEHIPPAVLSFMNALIPLLVNIIIIYGLSIIIFVYTGKDIPSLIMMILTPALTIGNNIWGYVAIVNFGNLLWLFGINGISIIFPRVFSLGSANTGINAELIKSGQEPQMLMNLQMFRVAILGGAGNTIGLVILMMRSRYQQLKSIGKLSFIPGICGINEPVIFGTPIILNPSFAPFFIQGYLSSMDIRNLIFTIFVAVLSIVIYYPFFKIHEKHMLEIENSI